MKKWTKIYLTTGKHWEILAGDLEDIQKFLNRESITLQEIIKIEFE